MKNVKCVLAMLLALCMVFALCACGQSASTTAPAATEAPAADAAAPADTAAATDGAKVGQTVLKCAFNQTIENPEAKTLQKLSDDLYDATEGRYSIEVYPDAQLGDQQQTLEQCTMDALDMTLVANSIIETSLSSALRTFTTASSISRRFSSPASWTTCSPPLVTTASSFSPLTPSALVTSTPVTRLSPLPKSLLV